jgi:phosphoglucomutase
MVGTINNEVAMNISPLAGKPAPLSLLVDVPKLVTAYFTEVPDPSVPEQRVLFGTSGHRGSAFQRSFNEAHILAISQAICLYRQQNSIDGPLFIGADTHALSAPALASAIEVLAANGVELMLAESDAYTPTPVISHAILTYNRGRSGGWADGIVITPSHNPPHEGGFKYNPPDGGPAEAAVTGWIEKQANQFLETGLQGIKRWPYEQALKATTTHYFDYMSHYVGDLANVLDLEKIKRANVRMCVDPLGGAGVHYWKRIADQYGLNLRIYSEEVDPTFRFMTVDWDGQIRMDPSSLYAMQRLLALKGDFDVAFACDTDHDRHGVVTKSAGLLPSNHYQAAAIHYLFQHRLGWPKTCAVGKTLVSSAMIDKVAHQLGRQVYEVPVGFKWFVPGLRQGFLGFAGEESAGASFLRQDGSVWTTDKDGIILALLAGEIKACTGQDPGELYAQLEQKFGPVFYRRIEAAASFEQKEKLKKISSKQIHSTTLGGEKIESVLTQAPGNGAAIGGVKVMAKSGWFAARPSGTEDLYKIYAESFVSEVHLERLLNEAQSIVDQTLKV